MFNKKRQRARRRRRHAKRDIDATLDACFWCEWYECDGTACHWCDPPWIDRDQDPCDRRLGSDTQLVYSSHGTTNVMRRLGCTRSLTAHPLTFRLALDPEVWLAQRPDARELRPATV